MAPAEELAHILLRLNALADALTVALEQGEGAEIDALIDAREPLLMRLRQIGLANRSLVLSDDAVKAMASREAELLQQAQRRRSELRRALFDIGRKASLEAAYGVA